jgi:hypothetical protein
MRLPNVYELDMAGTPDARAVRPQPQPSRSRNTPRIEQPQHLLSIAHNTHAATARQHRSLGARHGPNPNSASPGCYSEPGKRH